MRRLSSPLKRPQILGALATLLMAADYGWLATPVWAQTSTATRTIGLITHDERRASPGYTLMAPKHYGRTYLIDNYGQIINTWDSKYEPGQSAYLLPNGHMIRAAMAPGSGSLGTGGGEGGRLEEYDWDGNLVWEFDYYSSTYAIHHDFKVLPNGNVIALLVERKTRADALAAGFKADLLQNDFLLPDAVVEIEPIRPKGGKVVWEWHVWDHLIQNYDPAKSNYGEAGAHPELVDPNASPRKIPAFWNHMNSIDYNPAFDQILLSVRGNSEVWVIDHSTTAAEAAGHAGGKYGKGGDLLYRWGNPQMYYAGKAADQKLWEQHDAQWIEAGRAGAGNMLVFNNGVNRPGGNLSSADEFAPPNDASGQYEISSGLAYAPSQLTWTYADLTGTKWYESDISGAYRLPNGNTLLCYGTHGVLVEVTQEGEIVWQYVNPVSSTGPMAQGDTSGLDDRGHNQNAVFRVRRYPPGYSGLLGRSLTPKGVIEVSDASTTPVTPIAPGSSNYPEMALIPAGEFQMGDHAGFVDPQHPSDELPIHNVSLDSFYIGVYDVTNSQYIAFLNSASAQGLIEVRDGLVYRKGSTDIYCDTAQFDGSSSIGWDGTTFALADTRGTHPVVGIRWAGAAGYANWLSAELGLDACYDTATWRCDFSKNGYRLPTEAEWEYAARGGQTNPYYVYPWGNDADPARANWPIDASNPYRTGAYPWTTPAGFYNGTLRNKADFAWPGSQSTYQTMNGSNAFGLYDLAGNVWQWVNDWYRADYYSESPASNPKGPDMGAPMPDGLPYHGMRGGNWYNGDQSDPGHARVSNRDPGYYRGPQDPSHPYYHVGFRVARPATGALSPVSAASFSAGSIAPGSIVTAFGNGLAGDAVIVKDSKGVERGVQGLFVWAQQVNFIAPEATATGKATVTLVASGAPIASGSVLVEQLAPGLFSANADGKGVAAAVAVIVAADGSQTSQVVFDVTAPAGSRRGTPIDVSRAGENVYLMLFGTGMRNTTQTAAATIGGLEVAVVGPAAHEQIPGLDQVKLGPLPAALSGRGEVEIALSVEGKPANRVTVTIR
ncbi:MAG: SUMF1/EgtB/PvdO family nonheme iron enzyme [Acidobacteria bacterium]|nr:SUMF1/EgtB/PvdO family nonheme iron enzyme [Acidobacteriota bacterium]